MMRSRFLRAVGLLVLTLALTVAAQAQEITPISNATGWSYLTPYNGSLYFRANGAPAGGNDCELWRYDGTSATLAAEIKPGPTGSDPAHLGVYGSTLYFAASGPTGASKLYQFDGTSASLAPGSSSNLQNPEELFTYGGNLYFRAARFGSPGNIGIELWKFDGTNQTPLDLYTGSGSSYPQHFIEYNGRMYFNACAQAGQGTELWRLNTAGTGVELAAMIYPNNGSSPESFGLFDGKLYFSAYDGVRGRELWRYDGTNAEIAADICPGGQYSSSNPNGLTAYKGALYFSASDGVSGYELWRFDGTDAQKVAEINPTPNPGNGDDFLMDSSPANLTVYRDVLYFSANDGVHGRELWSYDGTNVAMVLDANPGQYGSEPSELTVWNDELIFLADRGYVPGGTPLAPSSWSLTPEPATLAMLAMGAVALLRRRRR